MGTLFDDPYVLDEEGERLKRQEEAEEYFDEEVPIDDGPYSWETFRREAREGLTVEDRHLIPYVTYIPKLLNADKENAEIGEYHDDDDSSVQSDIFPESITRQGQMSLNGNSLKYDDESTELDDDGQEYTIQSFLGLAKKQALHKSFLQIEENDQDR